MESKKNVVRVNESMLKEMVANAVIESIQEAIAADRKRKLEERITNKVFESVKRKLHESEGVEDEGFGETNKVKAGIEAMPEKMIGDDISVGIDEKSTIPGDKRPYGRYVSVNGKKFYSVDDIIEGINNGDIANPGPALMDAAEKIFSPTATKGPYAKVIMNKINNLRSMLG